MNTLRIACFLAAVGMAAPGGGTLVESAPAKAAKLPNPMETDQRAHRAGAKLYARELPRATARTGKAEGTLRRSLRPRARCFGFCAMVRFSGTCLPSPTCQKRNAGRSSPI